MKSILRELDCFVCYEPLKDPVYLHTCGHSLCLQCTRALLNPDNLTVTCPLDKTKTLFNLSKEGEIALPLNRPLMAISEAMTLHLRYCEICQTKPVDMICAYDLLRLCSACSKRHKANKHLRSHIFLGVDCVTICPDHQRKVLWMCFTEVKLLCCECGDFGDRHKLCEVLPLPKAKSKIVRMLRKVEKRTQELIVKAADLSERPELPGNLQQQSVQLRAVDKAVTQGPAMWVQAVQHCLDISRCQKAVTAALKKQQRGRVSRSV